jgi:hypothetical protein
LEEPTVPPPAYSDVIARAMQDLTPKITAETDRSKPISESHSDGSTVSDPFAMALGEVKQAVQSVHTSQSSFPSMPISPVHGSTMVDGGDV